MTGPFSHALSVTKIAAFFIGCIVVETADESASEQEKGALRL